MSFKYVNVFMFIFFYNEACFALLRCWFKIIDLFYCFAFLPAPPNEDIKGFRVALGFVYLYVAVLKKVRFFAIKIKTAFCLQLANIILIRFRYFV